MVEVLARLQDMGYQSSLNTFVTSSNLAEIVKSVASQQLFEVNCTGFQE